MVLRQLIILLLVGLLLAACGGDDDPKSSETSNQNSSNSTVEAAPSEQVVVQEALAATVNGDPITLARLEREIEIYEAGSLQPAADREALVGTVLETLIVDKLVEQAAAEMGLTVTDAEINEEIGLLEADAAAQGYSLADFFAVQGISQEEYPERMRTILLTQKVNETVTAEVPTTTTAVHARHILVADEATALSILEQLNAGADFAQLAQQYSLDPLTKDAGGDLDWAVPGVLVQKEVEAAIFSLPANARAPQPVRSALGYHIIESIERSDSYPLDETQLAEQRSIAWETWIAQRRAEAEIVRFVGPNAQE